jgi:hypothetical protein
VSEILLATFTFVNLRSDKKEALGTVAGTAGTSFPLLLLFLLLLLGEEDASTTLLVVAYERALFPPSAVFSIFLFLWGD